MMVAGDLFLVLLFTGWMLWIAYQGIIDRHIDAGFRYNRRWATPLVYKPEDAKGIYALIGGLWALLIAVFSVVLVFIGRNSNGQRIETPLGSIHPLEWILLGSICTALFSGLISALRLAVKLFQWMSHRTRNSSETH
jgi:hypothetical protein